MKKTLLSILMLTTFGVFAQNVNIPDANFKTYLVGEPLINTNGDTEIQVTEANSFGGLLDCSSMNISDLTGIEEFTSFFALNCNDNLLSDLPLGNNAFLYSISCDSNQITLLDLSQSSNLEWFSCSNNPPLQGVNVANGNNNMSQAFGFTNNPNLTCIQIDVGYSPNSFWAKDAIASYSIDCGFPCTVTIPDATFKAYLVGNAAINTNGDSEIQCSEASAFTGIINCSNMSISDLTGIEDFTALTGLRCYTNSLSSLNLSNNTDLTELSCSGNSLTALDISSNMALIELYCDDNSLTALDVSNNNGLTVIECSTNPLTVLEMSNNTSLTELYCQSTSLIVLELSNNTALTTLNCSDNNLTSLYVANGNNSNFAYFKADQNPNLTCIEVDDAAWSTTNWVNIDATVSFSENCSSIGIEENTIAFNLTPNPANGIVNIQSDQNIESISVLSTLGQEVLTTNQTSFDISNLTSGVYFVTLKTNGKLSSQKLIKK